MESKGFKTAKEKTKENQREEDILSVARKIKGWITKQKKKVEKIFFFFLTSNLFFFFIFYLFFPGQEKASQQ